MLALFFCRGRGYADSYGGGGLHYGAYSSFAVCPYVVSFALSLFFSPMQKALQPSLAVVPFCVSYIFEQPNSCSFQACQKIK